MPNVPQGQYLWTKETTLYSDGTTSVGYIATRMGVDGAGGARVILVLRVQKGKKGDKGDTGSRGPQGNQVYPVKKEKLDLRVRKAYKETKEFLAKMLIISR